MNTTEERIQFLLTKYKNDRLSIIELEELNTYVLDEEHEETMHQYLDNWLSDLREDNKLAIDSTKIYQNILSHPLFSDELINTRKQKVRILYYTSIAAAFALLVLATTSYYYLGENHTFRHLAIQHIEEKIKPGTNKAILSTSGGIEVLLSDAHDGVMIKEGVVSYGDGSAVLEQPIKPSRGNSSFSQLRTPRGGQYQVKLEDGTLVYLNAASSLKYPIRFEKENRTVELIGEAYFEIASDKKRPFYVVSKDQKVTVLGTKFNVSAYEDEHVITTTLMEGKVKVSNKANGVCKRLVPGQQSIYALGDGGLVVQEANLDAVSAWHRGYFDFSDQDLQSIMREIARWYDVAVVFNAKDFSTEPLEGGTSRFDSVEDVLAVLESTGLASFKLDGRKIIINKPK